MKKTLLAFVALVIADFNYAQTNSPLEHFKNMNMRSIGPAVMSGRVTSIDVVNGNENVIYIGTASGGLWKSESGGVTWQPLFDKQELIGIGSVCIDPSSPDIVWAGTGEGNPRNSHTSGAGIFRSPDGGQTWKKSGLENSFTIHRIIVHPKNSDVVYAGVHGSAWGPNSERGVFRTSNGGTTWDKVLFVNDSVGCADLVMDPHNSSKLFAAMYQYQRKPYHFTSGGKGSSLHMTLDGGKTWTKLTDKEGLPEGELGRIGLAISPSNPKIIYALIEAKKTALYKSTDGGYHWQMVNDKNVGDRPFYYHELYVDPSNENHLIYLHSIVSESIDGGKSWTTMIPYAKIHPDHHAFWWSKNDSRLMMEGNDGGFNISRDGGVTWTFINSLPLGQFYHINYDMDIPYHVYGGMQDNGSWKGPAYTWHGGGIRAADWQEVLFGDGFDVSVVPNNSRYLYAMSQGGEINYIDTETGSSRNVKPVHPEGKELRFHWNAGLAQDPFNDSGVYFGSQYVHYSKNCGLDWEIISPDLTTNDSTKLKQASSGGLTIDATAAENHCTIICITPSSHDKNVIWVGTDDGQLQLTKDGGKSWVNVASSIAGFPKFGWIPQIVVGSKNSAEAFVVVNNYRQNDWKPYLFHTKDYGVTWKNIATDKKIKGHCLSVAQDFMEEKLLFLGTENGLHISFDYGNSWHKWTENYPSVATQDLKIHPRESDLIIGTFGRAAYILDDISPLRKFAREGEKSFDKKLFALAIPDAYMAAYTQPLGERFPGDLDYSGTNRSSAARLGYYFQIEEELKKDSTKTSADSKKGKSKSADIETTKDSLKPDSTETKKKEEKKVTIHIRNMAGDTLRTFKHEPDTGLNFVNWRFDTKGVRFPSKNERKDDKDEPGGGVSVVPGKYQIIYQFGEFKDSSEVVVKYDPRLTWNDAAYEKIKAYSVRLQKTIQLADDGMEQLKAAKKTLDLVNSVFVNVPDSLKKNITNLGDSISKKINTLQNLILDMEDKSGIRDNSHLLISKIYDAYGYAEINGMGSNADYAMKKAESETRIVADKLNLFFEKDWTDWKTEVEKMQYNLFKEIKKL